LLPGVQSQLIVTLNATSLKEQCGVLAGKRNENEFCIEHFMPVRNYARSNHSFIIHEKEIETAMESVKKDNVFCGIFHTHYSDIRLSFADRLNVLVTMHLWLIGLKGTRRICSYLNINGKIKKLII